MTAICDALITLARRAETGCVPCGIETLIRRLTAIDEYDVEENPTLAALAIGFAIAYVKHNDPVKAIIWALVQMEMLQTDWAGPELDD